MAIKTSSHADTEARTLQDIVFGQVLIDSRQIFLLARESAEGARGHPIYTLARVFLPTLTQFLL